MISKIMLYLTYQTNTNRKKGKMTEQQISIIRLALKWCSERPNIEYMIPDTLFDGNYDIRFDTKTNEFKAIVYETYATRIFFSISNNLKHINQYAESLEEINISLAIIDELRKKLIVG